MRFFCKRNIFFYSFFMCGNFKGHHHVYVHVHGKLSTLVMTSKFKQGSILLWTRKHFFRKKIIINENILLWFCGIILPDFVME